MPPKPVFLIDDICTLKHEPDVVAVIERTHTDVEYHDPYPQETLGKIKKHRTIPRAAFKQFLEDGVPPPDTVLVSRTQGAPIQLLPEKELILADRHFVVGNVVKSRHEDPMSGVVLRVLENCDLKGMGQVKERQTGKSLHANWCKLLRDGDSPFSITEGSLVRNVPVHELKPCHRFNMAEHVIYMNWIGRIRDLSDEVTVRLLDGAVVIPKDELELSPYDRVTPLLTERFSAGDLVTTRKGNLRTGRWIYGAYNPNLRPVGTVVGVRTTEIEVDWLQSKIGTTGAPPSSVLGVDELESGQIVCYDRARRSAESPFAPESTVSATDIDIAFGARVQFSNLTEACAKYNGSDSRGLVSRLDRKDHLGYDMNTFIVTRVSSEVIVQWQDLSISTESSTDLIQDPGEDEDDLLPGEVVCTHAHSLGSETGFAIQPEKVGIVQKVDPRDRIAQVRWCANGLVQLSNDVDRSRLPTTVIGTPDKTVDSVSLYDIYAPSSLNVARGDFVFMRNYASLPSSEASNIDWIGEVVDSSLDGTCTVCLGAASEVRNIQIPADDLIIALRAVDDWESEEFDDDDMSYAYASDDGSVADRLTEAERTDMDLLMQMDSREDVQGHNDDEEEEAWSTESEALEHSLPDTDASDVLVAGDAATYTPNDNHESAAATELNSQTPRIASPPSIGAVSYTHLTLPTIYSV